MKTLNKIENIVITIVCAIVIWLTMFVGSFELLYESVDLYYEQAMLGAVLYGIVTGYWLIKKMVFRIIRICKR